MKLKEECLFIMPRSLEVCNSRVLQFFTSVATLARRRCDKIRKKIASPARATNRSCSRGLSHQYALIMVDLHLIIAQLKKNWECVSPELKRFPYILFKKRYRSSIDQEM